MAMINKLHEQVDQGKTAVLVFTMDGENIKISIGTDATEYYTSTIDYLDRPNPHPTPRTRQHRTWKAMLDDLPAIAETSDQWDIKK